MSYAHYWDWERPMADADKFARWSRDVQTLIDRFPAYPDLSNYEARVILTRNWSRPLPEGWYTKRICGPGGAGDPSSRIQRFRLMAMQAVRQIAKPSAFLYETFSAKRVVE